jgi:hypothetical protein
MELSNISFVQSLLHQKKKKKALGYAESSTSYQCKYPYISFFFVCRKFCEKWVNLYIFLFCRIIFGDLKGYIGIFMAHNYEHYFYVFYFHRIRNGRKKCQNQITAKKKKWI